MLAWDCGSQTGLDHEDIWVRDFISTRTYRTVENRDVLRKIMHLTHVLGRSIPPVDCDRTLRGGAEQFPFIDGEGHLGACEFERNRSNMVMPGMFPSRNAARSEAIGD